MKFHHFGKNILNNKKIKKNLLKGKKMCYNKRKERRREYEKNRVVFHSSISFYMHVKKKFYYKPMLRKKIKTILNQ